MNRPWLKAYIFPANYFIYVLQKSSKTIFCLQYAIIAVFCLTLFFLRWVMKKIKTSMRYSLLLVSNIESLTNVPKLAQSHNFFFKITLFVFPILKRFFVYKLKYSHIFFFTELPLYGREVSVKSVIKCCTSRNFGNKYCQTNSMT